jgi:hypothetical protein
MSVNSPFDTNKSRLSSKQHHNQPTGKRMPAEMPRETVIQALENEDTFKKVIVDPEKGAQPTGHFRELRNVLEQQPLKRAEIFGDDTHSAHPKLVANFAKYLAQQLSQTAQKVTPHTLTQELIRANAQLNEDALDFRRSHSSDSSDSEGSSIAEFCVIS